MPEKLPEVGPYSRPFPLMVDRKNAKPGVRTDGIRHTNEFMRCAWQLKENGFIGEGHYMG